MSIMVIAAADVLLGVQRRLDPDVRQVEGPGGGFESLISGMGPLLAGAVALVVLLGLTGLAITILRRGRLTRLYRRRSLLEAEVTELKEAVAARRRGPRAGRAEAGASHAPAPSAGDSDPCFFCALPLPRRALLCARCGRPSVRNLKAFARMEAERRRRHRRGIEGAQQPTPTSGPVPGYTAAPEERGPDQRKG